MFNTLDEALATFDHHMPSAGQIERIQEVREGAKLFAAKVWQACPSSADRTTALRYIHEAMMTANKSIVLEGSVTG